jgi:hypothetical protein
MIDDFCVIFVADDVSASAPHVSLDDIFVGDPIAVPLGPEELSKDSPVLAMAPAAHASTTLPVRDTSLSIGDKVSSVGTSPPSPKSVGTCMFADLKSPSPRLNLHHSMTDERLIRPQLIDTDVKPTSTKASVSFHTDVTPMMPARAQLKHAASKPHFRIAIPHCPDAKFFQQLSAICSLSSTHSNRSPAFTADAANEVSSLRRHWSVVSFPPFETLALSTSRSATAVSPTNSHELAGSSLESGVRGDVVDSQRPDASGPRPDVVSSEDCIFCAMERSASALHLVPFSVLLHHLLLQTTECILDSRWELRRCVTVYVSTYASVASV